MVVNTKLDTLKFKMRTSSLDIDIIGGVIMIEY